MQPPLVVALAAALTFVAISVAEVAGHPVIALALAPVLAALLGRIGLFWIRMRRAGPG